MMDERAVRDAMTCLHPSDDLYERVMAEASGAGGAGRAPRRRGRAVPLGLAIALALGVALATSGVAYAALSGVFGAQVWGATVSARPLRGARAPRVPRQPGPRASSGSTRNRFPLR